MKLDDEIRAGREAAQLLENPILSSAFEKVESDLINAMKVCVIGDRDTQHELILCLQLLGRVRREIQTVAETGKLAAIQKDRMN